MGNWRKSSYSGANGGHCVEVGTWRKSTHSQANGGSCVETASGSGVVLVRDTTDRGGFTLTLTAGAWTEFLSTLR
jgi:hypothetical protein